MSIPHRCPVCEGRGEVGKRLAQVGAILISGKPPRFRCHGCAGTGIVWDNTFQITNPQPLPVQPFPGPTWISNGNCNGIVDPGTQFTIDPMNGRCDIEDLTNQLKNGLSNGSIEYNANGDVSIEMEQTECACSPPGEPHSDNCKAALW